MAKHNETGINGEKIAENFLEKKGYLILHRNWRFGKKEVDLIATKDDMAILIEVKTRSSLFFGNPEDAVDSRKQEFLKIAAEAFLEEYPQFQKIQFDIVSILLQKGVAVDVLHFEDAFY